MSDITLERVETQEQIDTLAKKCCFGGRTIGLFKILHQEDIRTIYQMAKG